MKSKYIFFLLLSGFGCNDSQEIIPIKDDIYLIPVVVHVMHHGEEIGEGSNISDERIIRQIEILNEDFRRKKGTRGFNDHPVGGDTKIEFYLANEDPDNKPSNGIVRMNVTGIELPPDLPNTEFDYWGYFSLWDSRSYVNIWVVPYPDDMKNVLLGKATGPETDLPGHELLQKKTPGGAEGIIVNWNHFGESDIDGPHNLGRTLTHEMGHYFGLLHTWGGLDCEHNDYCLDTPAVDTYVYGSHERVGCEGDRVLIENYMNYTDDAIMNIFTKDQIERMHYVLENSPGRISLLN